MSGKTSVPPRGRQSNGTRRFTESRARAGSSASVAAACPPGESRHREVRYLDIREDDRLDEAQLAAWVKQASKLPGEEL
jgi:hypothetical protein